MLEPAAYPLADVLARIDRQQAETAAHMDRGLAELMRMREQDSCWRLAASDVLAFALGGIFATGIIFGHVLLCR